MIPFVRDFDFTYGVIDRVSPLIRRLIAPNPGPFTFTGTGVYIIGHGTVAVIDPGPLVPAHFDTLKAALADEIVSHILVTHGHLDHSPLAHPLAAHTGAKIYASAHTPLPPHETSEEGEDTTFTADVTLADGQILSGPGWTLRTLSTPGHTQGHLCFWLEEEQALFSGDHVMGWSTTVIAPPDGNMMDYLKSLARVRDLTPRTIWPTHGPPITTPRPFLDAYIAHRRMREAQILKALADGPQTIRALVPILYDGLDPALHPAAAQSLYAHMLKLLAEKRVETDSTANLMATYRRTADPAS